MVMTSTPRVRRSSLSDPSSKIIPTLKRKWQENADYDYQETYEQYMKIAEKCLWLRRVYLKTSSLKKRTEAKKRFLKVYPTMMALDQLHFDDYLPFDTTRILFRFYYKLSQR